MYYCTMKLNSHGNTVFLSHYSRLNLVADVQKTAVTRLADSQRGLVTVERQSRTAILLVLSLRVLDTM